MMKILVTEYFNSDDSKNFDKVIVLNDFYLHDDKKILKFNVNNLNKINKIKIYSYFVDVLKKFDKSLNSELCQISKTDFSNAKILETCCIERFLKYSILISVVLDHVKDSNFVYYFHHNTLKSRNDRHFAYQFIYYYLKYYKKLKVLKIKKYNNHHNIISNDLNKNFFILLFVLVYKIKILIKKKFLKFLFIFLVIFQKKKNILFLDTTNFFTENFNYRKKIFIKNYLFTNTKINIDLKNFSNKFEKILFSLVLSYNKKYLEKVLSINSFLKKNKKNFSSMIFTYPPTIYDFFKGICLELARLNNICRHCFQHGSDYGYNKNFITHFLKDYNNCDIFYAYAFDGYLLKKNNLEILSLFSSMPRISNLNVSKFKKIWSVPLPRFSFFNKIYVLYLATVYTSLIEQELIDQEKIFTMEIETLDQLSNEGHIIIYKANKKLSLVHLTFLKARYKNIIFLNYSLKTIMPLLKNIKIFSINFSTSHLELFTVNKKINYIAPSKYFLNKLDFSLLKKYSDLHFRF